MKVLVIADFGLNERTGGYSRNLQVLKRMSKRVELVIFPSTRNLVLSSQVGERLLRETLEEVGGEVHEVAQSLMGERFNSREEVLSRVPEGGERYDVVYVYGNSWTELEVARKLRGEAPVGVQLQLEPFYRDVSRLFRIKFRGPTCFSSMRFQNALRQSEEEREGWMRVLRAGSLHFILSVSSSPLKASGLDSLVEWAVIRPPNAFERTSAQSKDEYAIYFTRLIPEKGVFEIPLIWREVKKSKDLKLYVVGEFQYQEDEDAFLKLVRRLDVNVEHLGFKEGKGLFDLVSRARVTVYPSHYDSFSMVVLESLALGTPVVAYDTLALKEWYSGLEDVKIVKEDDVKGMAKETMSVLESWKGISPKTSSFLKFTSSWDKVTDSEVELLYKFAAFNRGVNRH